MIFLRVAQKKCLNTRVLLVNQTIKKLSTVQNVRETRKIDAKMFSTPLPRNLHVPKAMILQTCFTPFAYKLMNFLLRNKYPNSNQIKKFSLLCFVVIFRNLILWTKGKRYSIGCRN